MPATSKEGCLHRHRERDNCWDHVKLTFMENCEARFDVWDRDLQMRTSDTTVTIQHATITLRHEEDRQFKIHTKSDTIRLLATDMKERNEWVDAIRSQLCKRQTSSSCYQEYDSSSCNGDSDNTSSCAASRSYTKKWEFPKEEMNPNKRNGGNTAPYPDQFSSPSQCPFTPTSSPYSPNSSPPGFNFDHNYRNRVYQEFPHSTPTYPPSNSFTPTYSQHCWHPPPAEFQSIGNSQLYPFSPSLQNNFKYSHSTGAAGYPGLPYGEPNGHYPFNRKQNEGLQRQFTRAGIKLACHAFEGPGLALQLLSNSVDFFG